MSMIPEMNNSFESFCFFFWEWDCWFMILIDVVHLKPNMIRSLICLICRIPEDEVDYMLPPAPASTSRFWLLK